MEPHKNPQRTNLYRPWRQDLRAAQSRIIYGRSVRCPYRPCSRDQASQSFLCGNAESFLSVSRLADSLSKRMDGRVRWPQRHISVGFARPPLAPFGVIVLIGCRHSFYIATEIVVNASYVRVMLGIFQIQR